MNFAKTKSLIRKAGVFSVAALIFFSVGAFVLPQTNDTSITAEAAVAAKSVKLNKTSLSLGKKETFTLTASLSPSNASKTLRWSTSNSKVATVSKGKIKAKSVGKAIITVKTLSGKTAKCKVTVKNPPSKLGLNKSSLTLGVKETYTLKKSLPSKTASNKMSFSSSNKKVATVTASGKITAKKTGTLTITAKTYNGKTAKCKVTVKKAPSKVTLNKTSITLGVKETFTLKHTLPSATASNKIFYTSSDGKIATVNAGGKVTAKKKGTVTITVKTYNGKTAKCKVTVKAAPTKVSFSPKTVYLYPGQTKTINAVFKTGQYSQKRIYANFNDSVIKMTKSSGSATFKALKVGISYITVRTYNNKTAQCKVVVRKYNNVVKLTEKMLATIGTKPKNPTLLTKNGKTTKTTTGSYLDVLMLEDSGLITSIAYNRSTDKLEMIYMNNDTKNKKIYVMAMQLDLNNSNTAKVAFGRVSNSDRALDSAIIVRSDFNVKEYTSSTKLTYRLSDRGKKNVTKSEKALTTTYAKTYLSKAIKTWNQLLQKNYGMNLKQIGFAKYS